MNMEFGLKLWSTNIGLIDQAIRLIDDRIFNYIELFMIPDTQISPFIIDIPYIIHIPHQSFNVNIGESSKKNYNLKIINESIKWADKLDARYLILHAGYGSMEDAADLLSEITDRRILIENMPKVGIDGEKMIGYLPIHIEQLIDDNNIGLCLDFGHAIKASISLNMDFRTIIQGFLTLNPGVFHISDGNLDVEKDEHLNIGAGTYDFSYFKNIINDNPSKLVTLETPRHNDLSLEEDIENIEALKLLWES